MDRGASGSSSLQLIVMVDKVSKMVIGDDNAEAEAISRKKGSRRGKRYRRPP
jgi:hypothetical protein